VAGAVKMRVVATAPAITLSEAVIRQGAPIDPEADFAQYRATLQTAFAELAILIDSAGGS